MRYGRRTKANELLRQLDLAARVLLVVTSMVVTRLGVFLLVGR
jgi:hypothetical protein